jgi:hypothetical protein
MKTKETVEITAKTLRHLQDAWLNAKLFGEEPVTNIDMIVSDKRKAGPYRRALVDAHLVSVSVHDEKLRIAPKVLAGIEAIKPKLTLADGFTGHDRTALIEGRAVVGIHYFNLPVEERLWCFQHAADYRWFWCQRLGLEETTWTPGTRPASRWNSTLYIIDEPLRIEVAAAQRKRRVDLALSSTLTWGLTSLAEVPADQAKDFKSIVSCPFRGDPSTFLASTDWEADAAKYLAEARAEVDRANAQLEAARVVAAKVAKVGGWVKFRGQLTAAIEKSIDDESE